MNTNELDKIYIGSNEVTKLYNGNNLIWSGDTPLIFKIKTDNEGVSDNNSFTIPVRSAYTYNYTVDWGGGVINTNVTGSITHTYDTAGEKTIKIYGLFPQFYFNNGGDRLKVLSVESWGDVEYSNVDMEQSFWGCTNLSHIADGASWFNNLTRGYAMFQSTNLTSLPDGMALDNLTDGPFMFRETNLTSLPDGMTLGNLINGASMFFSTNLTSLPDGMTLNNLTSGGSMFRQVNLTSLPDSMALNSLISGSSMFRSTQLTSLPDGIKFSSLTNGTGILQGTTINTERYSQLLIDMEANNLNSDVPFHGGNSKYNSSAVTARANLVARGWTITDGGLE